MNRFKMMGRIGRIGLVALAATGVSACDDIGSIISNPDVPLWVNHPGSSVSIVSRRELTAKSRKEGEPYERGRPEIDPAHRRVFVGSRDHGLYALNAVDLETMWRFETAGGVQSEPLYVAAEDVVYFGSNDGAVYKLRAVDGRMLWRFASNAEITRQPVLTNGILFVMNANDTLIAIDPQSGELKWYRHRTPAAGMEISGYAGVSAHDQTVFTAFSDGVVMAYRQVDGAEAWRGPVDLAADAEATVGAEALRYLDVDTTPIVGRAKDKDVVFVASYEGGVYALDTLSGERVWHNDAPHGVTELTLWDGPVRDDDSKRHRMLIASSGLSGMWGLDPDSGVKVWRRDLPSGGVTAAAPWAGALLVGTTRYGVYLFHPLDGGVLDGLSSGGAFAASPAAHGRYAYIMSNDGVLLGLSIEPPSAQAL